MKKQYIIMFLLGMLFFACTDWFFGKYRLQSPIILRSPFVSKFISPEGSKKPSIIKMTPTPTIIPSPTKIPVPVRRNRRSSIIKEVEASEVYLTSDEEIINYIKSKDWDSRIAIALAKSENFWNLTKSFNCSRTGKQNTNGTYDHGLWQINDLHIKSGAITLADANDCFKATDFAYGLYKGRGNSFSAWSAYNNGSYLNHLD